MASRRTAILVALFAVLLSASAARADGTIAWSTTGGPTGGRVNALVAAPNSPGVMYAGTDGGIFFSRDDGDHWQSVSKGLPDDPTITAIAVSSDPKVVFAGTKKGVYRTRDAGANWTLADPRFADQFIRALLIDPQTPNVVYAGTTTTVLRSDNLGDAWSDVGADLRLAGVWALGTTPDATTLYAASDIGVFSTRDRGVRWQPSSDGLPEGAHPQSLAITARGFVAGTSQGLFRSHDGKTWSAVGGAWGAALARPLNNDPRQPDRIYAVIPQGVIKSTDGGANWALLPNPSPDTPILSLAPTDRNSLYAGTARGVWKTGDDGANWQLLNRGLVSTSVHNLLAVPGNPYSLLAATRFGPYLSPDRGTTWNDARGLTDPYVLSFALHPDNPKQIYAGTWGSSLFLSRDGGASFTRLTENLANHAPISSLAVVRAPDKSILLFAGTLGNGLFRSSDGGQKWIAQSAGLSDVTRMTTLTLVPPSTLFAGTERGLYRLDAANPSAAWQMVSPELPADEARALVVDLKRPQSLYVAFASSGLYRSDDNGAQWKPLGRGAFATRVRFQALALNPTRSQVMYVGTDRGIYRSDDGGATWTASNGGLPPSGDIQAIVVDPQAPDNIYAGTNGNGVVHGVDRLGLALPSDVLPGLVVSVVGLLAVGLVGITWRARFGPAARGRLWAREWSQWEAAIADALRSTGEAHEENLGKLPRRHLVRAMQRYMDQHPYDALSLQGPPPILIQENFSATVRFLSHWKAAWEVIDSTEAFESVTSQIVDQLCTLLGFTRVDRRSYKGLMGYVVRAPALRLKIPPRFPMIFVRHRQATAEDLVALRDLMGILDMASYFALILDLDDTAAGEDPRSLTRLVREATHDFIVLDGRDVRDLVTARDHARRLVDIILSQVDLTVVSPYVTSGPVPANMFFGREHELKTITRTVRDTNFAIVGGRKIGKTSVLARVHQLLQEAPEFRPYYLDCQAVHSHGAFFEAVDAMWKTSLPSPTPEGFRRMAAGLLEQYPSHIIVMLFDEIDGLLQHDIAQGEHLFRILRALSQEGPFRYIFCGEKTLNGSLHDPRLAFFNFCSLLPLTYLSREEARRVVVDPMQEMGIALEEDGDLADQIFDLTAGHPNMVQYICQKLIERINQRRERLILRSDLNAVGQSAEFAEYFAEVSWGNANALERLITLLMLDQAQTTVGEAAHLLRTRNLQVTPEQLESAFEGLALYSILRRDGPKYAFAAKAFPQILRRSQDIYGLVLSFTEEIQRGYGAKQ